MTADASGLNHGRRQRRYAWLPCFVFGLAMAVLADPRTLGAQTPVVGDTPCWREVSAEVGVDFVHRHFGQGDKLMPENMGSGVAIFDADGDGRLDLYFVQGAPLQPPKGSEPKTASASDPARNRFFRQTADGGFIDQTEASGLGDTGYGMGLTVGDIDSDGHPDVYVTNFGSDVYFHNRGDGTFEDWTTRSGLGLDGWSTGAAFLDLEGDGDLDLYVSRYLEIDLEQSKWCGNAKRKLRSYCHPDVYDGASDALFRNRGDGTFDEVSGSVKLQPAAQAKGLGVLTADLDGDDHQDILVANDSTMNHFYRGQGQGKLLEEALFSGLGFNATGAAEASMGLAFADLDGDGAGEVFMTHLDQETNTLYRGQGQGLFVDATAAAKLASPSLPWVGFGTVPLDFDLDGDLDLFVANGHILDNIALFDASSSHRQPAQLFANDGRGRFVDVSALLGLEEPLVGRGVATGDLDGDGDQDLVVSQNGDRGLVLRNTCGDGKASIAVQLIATRGHRDALGTTAVLEIGERRQSRFVVGGGSYLSHSDRRLHFAVPADPAASAKSQTEIRLRVTWAKGSSGKGFTELYRGLRAGNLYRISEGSDRLVAEPLAGTSSSSSSAPSRSQPVVTSATHPESNQE